MSVFNRIFRFWKGHNRSGMVKMTGTLVIGTAGAITTADTPGFTVTKTNAKTGRYRVQLVDVDGSAAAPAQAQDSAGTAVEPWAIQAPSVMVASANADAALTKDSATKAAIRNYTPKSGYFDIQMYTDITSTGETHVDAEVESSGIIFISFEVKLSSVVP